MKKFALLAALLLVCPPLMAHPGHAMPGLAHDLAHALWLVEGFVVLAVVLALGLNRRQREP